MSTTNKTNTKLKELKMKIEFVKNIFDVEVDGLKGINNYKIYSMFEEIHPEGFAKTRLKLIDEFEMTWKEINRDGGISAVNKDIREVYNIQ